MLGGCKRLPPIVDKTGVAVVIKNLDNFQQQVTNDPQSSACCCKKKRCVIYGQTRGSKWQGWWWIERSITYCTPSFTAGRRDIGVEERRGGEPIPACNGTIDWITHTHTHWQRRAKGGALPQLFLSMYIMAWRLLFFSPVVGFFFIYYFLNMFSV